MKKVEKYLRALRHRTCRAIYYWDSCPSDCRKNWKRHFGTIIAGVIIALGFIVIMIAIFLLTNS